jgi:ABC-type proline/glycine betaine transport system ATPase subunit
MEIDINEVEEININKMDKRQMANRLNALVKLAQGDTFTTHDLDEAITLTKKLNG